MLRICAVQDYDLVFVSADTRLVRAAKLEGLQTIHPEIDDLLVVEASFEIEIEASFLFSLKLLPDLLRLRVQFLQLQPHAHHIRQLALNPMPIRRRHERAVA